MPEDMTNEVEEARKPYSNEVVFQPTNPDDYVATSAEFYRKLYQNNEVVIEQGGNSYSSYTNLLSPDWYNRTVKGREELLGWGPKPNMMNEWKPGGSNNIISGPGANPNLAHLQDPLFKQFFRPPPIDPQTSLAMADALSKHWQNVEETDPETAWVYQVHPMLLFADAELAAKEGGNPLLAELDNSTRSGAFLTGTATSPWEYEELEETLRKGENTSLFLDEFIPNFDDQQQDVIGYAFAITDINRREWMASQGRNWWESGDRDIDNPADRADFTNWMYELGKNAQTQSAEERGAWNTKLWNPVDAAFGTFQFKDFLRRNFLPNMRRLLRGDETDWTPGNRGWGSYFDMDNKYDPQHYQYTGSVPDPKTWAYETNLTVGQQLAASAGWGVEDRSWAVASTLVDGFLYVATPGDLALAALTGGTATAGKIARVGMEPLSKLGRVKLAAKASVPVFGRRWASKEAAHMLPRGVMNRVGWAFRNRNMQEFMDEAAKRGVIRGWYDDWASGGVGKVLDKNENLTPIAGSGWEQVLEKAVLADDYDTFEKAIRMATVGAADDTAARQLDDMLQERIRLQAEIDSEAANQMAKEVLQAAIDDKTVRLNGSMLDWAQTNAPDGAFARIDESGKIEWVEDLVANHNTTEGWNVLREMIDAEPDNWYFIKNRNEFDIRINPDPSLPSAKKGYDDFIARLKMGGRMWEPDEVPPIFRMDDVYEYRRLEEYDEVQDIAFAKNWQLRKRVARLADDAKQPKFATKQQQEEWAAQHGQPQIIARDVGSGRTIRNEAAQKYRIEPQVAASSLTEMAVDTIIDLGEGHGVRGPDGEELRRFVPSWVPAGDNVAHFNSQIPNQVSFDSLDEAVAYLFQWNADARLNSLLSWDNPTAYNGMDVFDVGASTADKAEKVRGWFNGSMNGDPTELARIIENLPDELPIIATVFSSERVNSGSAFTRSMHIYKQLLDPEVPLRQIATDNVHAVQNSLIGSLLERLEIGRVLDSDAEVFTVDEMLASLRKETATNRDLIVTGDERAAFRAFAEDMTARLQEFQRIISEGDNIRGLDDLYRDPETGWKVGAWLDDLRDEHLDFLLDNQNEQMRWKTQSHPRWRTNEDPDFAYFEPYLFQDAGVPSSINMHILDEGPSLLPDRMVEKIHTRFLDAAAFFFTDAAVPMLADEALRGVAENAARKTADLVPAGAGDEWFDWRTLSKNPSAKHAFGMRMLDEWNGLQAAFRDALHYKSADNPMVPLFRAGRTDAPGRVTSYGLGSEWQGFAHGDSIPQHSYVHLDDASFAGAERIVKMVVGNKSHHDMGMEVLTSPAQTMNPADFGHRFGAVRQETAGVDVEGLVKAYFQNPESETLKALVEPKIKAKFGELGHKSVNGQLLDGKRVGKDGYQFYSDGLDQSRFVNAEKQQRVNLLGEQIKFKRITDQLQAVVHDTPKLNTTFADILGESFQGAGKAAKGGERQTFASAFRRTRARAFSPGIPDTIDMADMAHATSELKRVMHALGLSTPARQELLGKWAMAPVGKRGDIIEEVFAVAGRESGNPILEHMFGRAIKNSRLRRSSSAADGEGFARDLGQTKQGFVSPSPSYGGTKFIMPDETLFRMMSRYRKSGVLPDWAVRGLKDDTVGKRQNILKALRETVGDEVADQLGEDELLRMAYAMIAPSGQPEWDGVGAIAKWMRKYPGQAWNFVHGTFSRMVLTLQPIRWMIKVAIMEEPVRGALMGMPSFLIDPLTSGRDMIHAFNVNKYDNLARKFDDIVQEQVRVFKGADSAERLNLYAALVDEFPAGDVSPEMYRRAMTDYLKRAVREDDLVDDKTPGVIAATIKKNKRDVKRLVKIEDENVARGLRPDFTWDDVDEIVSKSLFSTFISNMEATGPLHYSPNDAANFGRFSRGWARELNRAAMDPFMSLAGDWHYAGETGEGARRAAVARLKADPQWPFYKDNAKMILEEKLGYVPKNLEQAYLEHLGEHVERLYRPLLNDADDPLASWTAIKRGDFDAELDDLYTINVRDEESLASTLNAMIAANRGDSAFNARVPGFIDTPFRETFTEYGAEAQFKGKKKGPFKAYTDWALRTFGENATQVLNRRPAYLWKYEQTYKGLRKLGLDDNLARQAAHRKAFEAVNHVYFNQDHIPPLIRKMNRVIPFFGAQFEIAQTWLFKIPFAQGSFLSPLTLVRKLDKMFAGFANSGILDVRFEEEDKIGEAPVARYQLSFTPGGSKADSLVGQIMNDAGVMFHDGLLRTGVFIRNLLHEENVQFEDIAPGDYVIDLANPLDPSRENQGILAVNSLFITPTPGAKPAINWLARNLSISGSNDVVKGGGKMHTFIAQHGVERARFLAENRDVLVGEWGLETYRNALDNADVNPLLPDVALVLPGTSWYDTFIQPWLYPMGYPENEVYTWTEFIPSTLKYGMRALGIGQGTDNPESWWYTDEDGNQDTVGMLTSMMLPTRTDRALASSAVITAMQNYEARTGAISQFSELSEKLQTIMDQAIAENDGEKGPDGEFLWSVMGSPYEKEWNETYERLEMLRQDIFRNGFRDAANTIGMRGFIGFLSPATPKFVYEEQQAVQNYWEASENAQEAEGVKPTGPDGLPNLYAEFDPRGVLDVDAFNDLFKAFLEDPSNKEPRRLLRERMPELFAFTYGKSYWGKAGVPAEVSTIDEYFSQMESGERQPMDPVVWMQRVGRAHISVEREASILQSYGDEPVEAAAQILGDWRTYKETISDPASRAYDVLDWYDDEMFDGKYIEWVQRGEEDDVFTAEITRQTLDLQDAIDQMEELVPSFYEGENLKEYASALAAMSSQVGDAAAALGHSYDRYGVQSERDRVLSWYFDTQVGGYYGKLGTLYDQLDQADTDQEAAWVYDQIRQVNDQYSAPVQYGFKGLPSVQDWRWGRYSEDEKQRRLMDWVDNPVDWLGADAISRLKTEIPQLEQYLPQNAAEYQLFQEYARVRNDISEMADYNEETGERYATEYQVRQARDRLESELRGKLFAAGRGDLVEYMDMTPIERFGVAGMLPASVNPLAGEAMGLRKALEAADKGSGNQQVLVSYVDPMFARHRETMRNNPEYEQFFRMLGQNLYGEIDSRTIFDVFVLGEYWKAG